MFRRDEFLFFSFSFSFFFLTQSVSSFSPFQKSNRAKRKENKIGQLLARCKVRSCVCCIVSIIQKGNHARKKDAASLS